MQDTYLGADGEVKQIESPDARELWEEDTITALVRVCCDVATFLLAISASIPTIVCLLASAVCLLLAR